VRAATGDIPVTVTVSQAARHSAAGGLSSLRVIPCGRRAAGDVWIVTCTDENELIETGLGYQYVAGRIPPGRITLAGQHCHAGAQLFSRVADPAHAQVVADARAGTGPGRILLHMVRHSDCKVPHLAVRWTYEQGCQSLVMEVASVATIETRHRSRRLELRTTPEEREIIDRAAAASDTGLTEFVVGSAVEAAQRVLADRVRFELDAAAAEAWEAMNSRPARELPGLRRLMERPSPFAG
jgi:uncharacterized protein (DUF1778 family)